MAEAKHTTANQAPPEALEASPVARPLYRRDYCTWATEQAEALRGRDLAAVDWEHLVKELEHRVWCEGQEWMSNCIVAIERLLTIEHARPECDVWDWMADVNSGRRLDMMNTLKNNGGLNGELLTLLGKAWREARVRVVALLPEDEPGTNQDKNIRRAVLDDLIPEQCPWELVEVAGYNPISDSIPVIPRDDVWPPAVSARLNQALGGDFYEGGWTTDPDSGELLERDGRPADSRNLPPVP